MPLTGRYASLGDQVKNGYELAFEELNKTSKMQLTLKVLDDESDPTKTVQRIESVTASDSPLALLGGAGSDLHAAAAAVADKNKTPYIGVAFALLSVHQRGLKYLFSPFQKSPQISKTLFDMADAQSPKPTRVAIFAEKTDWGAELEGLWKQDASSRGYEIVTDEQYTPGATDYSALILKAKSANADALLALPSPPDGMAIAKQMKELDFIPKLNFMIRAPDGLVWAQNLGKDGDYFVNSPGWHPDLKFAGVAQVVQAHQAKYNKPAEALVGAAYAAVQVLFDAVNRVGKPDRDALRDGLAATDLMTVAGPIKFNADGTAQVISVMNQWLGGKQVLVWPKDQATQPLSYPAKPWSGR
jgi:branched-chain amino acid transport system substrate-binding protein